MSQRLAEMKAETESSIFSYKMVWFTKNMRNSAFKQNVKQKTIYTNTCSMERKIENKNQESLIEQLKRLIKNVDVKRFQDV